MTAQDVLVKTFRVTNRLYVIFAEKLKMKKDRIPVRSFTHVASVRKSMSVTALSIFMSDFTRAKNRTPVRPTAAPRHIVRGP